MTEAKVLTKAERTIQDMTALFKARCSLVVVVSREEVRAERGIVEAAAAAKREAKLWDCAAGLQDASGKKIGEPNLADPREMLKRIEASNDGAVYVLRDLHKWYDPVVLRWLRNSARGLQVKAAGGAVVILTPSTEAIPPELAGHAIVIDYPLPDRPEMARILDDVLASVPESYSAGVTNGKREAAIDAAVGLTAEEASNCFARSFVTNATIDPLVVAQEKKRVIARERVLTWYEPDPRGLDAVGGLDLFKDWLVLRRLALTQKAREYGLPAPKGVLLLGPPGTGKSLSAKAIATAWGIPLLKLDLGALKSKFVGESEAQIRKALAVAESVAPVIVWIDEIEKAVSTGEQADGGVSQDQLGVLLSWQQERAGSVFLIATANNVEALPPELLRKGRFDELFFIDLPQPKERAAIIAATLKQFGRDPEKVGDTSELVRMTEGWSGAEIASVVPDALFTAFADGERELTVADIVKAAKPVVPLSSTARERIERLREWAKVRCRPASTSEKESTTVGRRLDLN